MSLRSSNAFHYCHQQLQCEAVPLAELVAQIGTPVYVYSKSEIVRRAIRFRNALEPYGEPGMACYAAKANLNLVILRLLAELGLGAEVNSGGELSAARQSGFAPDRIVFSGVGKRAAEIRNALVNGIRAFHVESAQEMDRLAEIAQSEQLIARLAVRVNPDVSAPTHPNISTGQASHKFGVPYDHAFALTINAADHPWLQPVGLATHIGSQIGDLAPYAVALERLLALAADLRQRGVELTYLDLGGGLAIDYAKDEPPSLAAWVEFLGPPIKAAGYRLILEPGRALVGPAGAILTTVEYTKLTDSGAFVIVDAAMNDLLRPALYQANHPIVPFHQHAAVARGESADSPLPQSIKIVGPVCETTDQLGTIAGSLHLKTGDHLAIMQAGAYGFAMSSQYNGRPRAAEVLVSDDHFWIIRRREKVEDLWYHCPDSGILDVQKSKSEDD